MKYAPTVKLLLIAGLALAPASLVLAQSRAALKTARQRMVREEIAGAGVSDPRVIEAMETTPRHEFVPLAQRKFAYLDMALPIGHGQTISPPFVVATMTEALDPKPDDRVLEIGTGSGYQAAVLAELVDEVYSIEIVGPLGRQAARTLRRLGYRNVHTKIGDGFKGWPSEAPFDKIIVTCSPEGVPRALAAQLKEGGRMVIPVGERYQQTLYLLTKRGGKLQAEGLRPTLFVPMTGAAEERRKVQPDPADPKLENGDFEKTMGEAEALRPRGWHYQRQLELVKAPDAPSGRRFVRFSNDDAGRGAQALQGFAIDGREVPKLVFSLRVRGENIRPGQNRHQLPRLTVTFYDENRAILGQETIGPWHSTFDWQPERRVIDVPTRAREAIVRIGLEGGVGSIAFDAIEMEPAR
jgi:protein-L-isoaspartate(D-aspartate) O-methyltransferase